MANVLVLYAAATPIEKSHTAALVNRYIKYYKEINPNDEINWLDLNTEETITSSVLNTNNSATFFSDGDKYIEQLKNIDKLIVATPMNNFSYSGLLKNYFDHILVAKKTFEYKYDGFRKSVGLLTNLKVQILATQGAPKNWYPWGDIIKLLEGTFSFVGASINRSILIGGTKTSLYKNKSNEEIVDDYDGEIRDIVKTF